MRLVPMTADDEDLAVRLECDPEMMLHAGGPRPESDVRSAHKRRLDLMGKGEAHMYKILADHCEDVLGAIGIWKTHWKGPRNWEMGWFVLPQHQGRGVATEAARLVLSQARSDPEIRHIHAYPTVANAASNAIARKIGMDNHGEFDNEGFAGVLRCNDWCIDLRTTSMAKKHPATIDEYIEGAPPPARSHLRQMYRILKDVAPDGTAAIKWGVPVFWQGRVLFGFAAYKAHVSFGPGAAAIDHFSAELAGYKAGKGTIQIPYDEPVPEDLVRKMAAFCIDTDRGAA